MSKTILYWVSLGVGVPVGLYLLVLILLYLVQGSLLFLPPNISDEELDHLRSSSQAERVDLTASDGTALQTWHYRSHGARVVIYTHGNGGNLANSLPLKAHLRRNGWDVLAVGYRGYPGSEGSPSEAGLHQDIRAVYDYAVHTMGVSPENIVLHGRSLGGGVAGTLMLDVPIGGLVLQSTFTSAADLAAELYPFFPVRWLMIHPFDTRSRASAFTGPVLILHSDVDEVVPVHHGRALSKVFPDVKYVEVQGYSHNDDMLLVDVLAMKEYMAYLNTVVPGGESNE